MQREYPRERARQEKSFCLFDSIRRLVGTPDQPGWLAELGHTELKVALCIMNHANADGIAWPSVARIAATLGIAARNVQRAMQALEAKRIIAVLDAGGGRGKSAKRRIEVPTKTTAHSASVKTRNPGAGRQQTTAQGDAKPRRTAPYELPMNYPKNKPPPQKYADKAEAVVEIKDLIMGGNIGANDADAHRFAELAFKHGRDAEFVRKCVMLTSRNRRMRSPLGFLRRCIERGPDDVDFNPIRQQLALEAISKRIDEESEAADAQPEPEAVIPQAPPPAKPRRQQQRQEEVPRELIAAMSPDVQSVMMHLEDAYLEHHRVQYIEAKQSKYGIFARKLTTAELRDIANLRGIPQLAAADVLLAAFHEAFPATERTA